jgi:hypothetical protein
VIKWHVKVFTTEKSVNVWFRNAILWTRLNIFTWDKRGNMKLICPCMLTIIVETKPTGCPCIKHSVTLSTHTLKLTLN